MKRSIGTTSLAAVVALLLLLAGVAQATHPESRVLSRNSAARQAVAPEQQPSNATAEDQASGAEAAQQAQQTAQTDQGAQQQAGPTVTTQETLEPTPEDKQRAVAAQQVASATEQKLAAQVRGLQALMEKEEQALAQRLAYAAKIRAQGLAKNDQKLLNQAEQFERQALEYYQKRVQQFENLQLAPEPSSSNARQPSRSTKPAPSYQGSRSSSQSSHPYRSGYRTQRYSPR